MDRRRKWADALIVSRRTLVIDNPNLFVRTMDTPMHPLPVIVMRNQEEKIPSGLRVFKKPHPPGEIWIEGEGELAPEDVIEEASDSSTKAHIQRWKIFRFQNLEEIPESLTQRGKKKLLLEGGPKLNFHFFRLQLIDELFITLIPELWGGETNDRLLEGSEMLSGVKLRLLSSERRGDVIFLRYLVRYKN